MLITLITSTMFQFLCKPLLLHNVVSLMCVQDGQAQSKIANLRNSGFYRTLVYDKTKLGGPSFLTKEGTPMRNYLLGDAGYPILYD